MDVTTLNKANDLNRKINEITDILRCFTWPDDMGPKNISRFPLLIIEFDSEEGGRDHRKLPIEMSDDMIAYIKNELISARDEAVFEFNNL